MKILVTGGGGFLGRHIVNQLLGRGESVRVIGRSAYPDLAARGVECVQASLTDEAAITQACNCVYAVIHVASLAGIWGRRSTYFATNVTGTRNVISACRRAGVGRLVYTSTPSVVYGHDSIDGGDETLPYPDHYLTHYAETKAMAERDILAANCGSLKTCSLRPHLIWGPGDTNLLPRLAARAKSGRLMRIGDGTNRVSVSYVENVADAHLCALDRLVDGSPVCGQAYFVNEPDPVNCWEFIGRLLQAMGCPPVKRAVGLKTAYRLGWAIETAYRFLKIEREPPMTRFLALQLATSHWFHSARAMRDLQWTPRISIDDGLHRLKLKT